MRPDQFVLGLAVLGTFGVLFALSGEAGAKRGRLRWMVSQAGGVLPDGSLFEIGQAWGTSVIGGLARLDGVPVVVYGENPMMYGGGWTADSCRKLTRLIDLASLFKLPIVHFEDCPGFLIGIESERDATVRYAPG